MFAPPGADAAARAPSQTPRRGRLGGRLRDLLRRNLRGRGQRRLEVGTELVARTRRGPTGPSSRPTRAPRRRPIPTWPRALDVLDELGRQFTKGKSSATRRSPSRRAAMRSQKSSFFRVGRRADLKRKRVESTISSAATSAFARHGRLGRASARARQQRARAPLQGRRASSPAV